MKPLTREILEANSHCYEEFRNEVKKRYPFVNDVFTGYCCGWTIESNIEEYNEMEFESFFEMIAFLEKELLLWTITRNDLGSPINTLSEGFPKRLEIFAEVNSEREAQFDKWGAQNHQPITWCAILGEEVGEVMKAAVQAKFEEGNINEYRAELIQTAAVCFQMVECFDRKNS